VDAREAPKISVQAQKGIRYAQMGDVPSASVACTRHRMSSSAQHARVVALVAACLRT
jgi:hypothetical protein